MFCFNLQRISKSCIVRVYSIIWNNSKSKCVLCYLSFNSGFNNINKLIVLFFHLSVVIYLNYIIVLISQTKQEHYLLITKTVSDFFPFGVKSKKVRLVHVDLNKLEIHSLSVNVSNRTQNFSSIGFSETEDTVYA